jgi:tripartite-type tricarboxylate transporter receptor subunit TctC
MNKLSKFGFSKRVFALGAASLLMASQGLWAQSQSYPNKPVKVVVTFPPGGTPDIYGRILSQELSTLWKQSVIVENKTGASGMIGTDFVAKSVPDGYTQLIRGPIQSG